MTNYITHPQKIHLDYDFVKDHTTLDQYFKDDFIPTKKKIIEYRPRFHKHPPEYYQHIVEDKGAKPEKVVLEKWDYVRDPKDERKVEEKLRKLTLFDSSNSFTHEVNY